jgi:hypothetical protein
VSAKNVNDAWGAAIVPAAPKTKTKTPVSV